nr:hypothetical protein CFP56_66870 [Quercus suber]
MVLDGFVQSDGDLRTLLAAHGRPMSVRSSSFDWAVGRLDGEAHHHARDQEAVKNLPWNYKDPASGGWGSRKVCLSTHRRPTRRDLGRERAWKIATASLTSVVPTPEPDHLISVIQPTSRQLHRHRVSGHPYLAS